MKKIVLTCALAACASAPRPAPLPPLQPAETGGTLAQEVSGCPSAVQGAETRVYKTADGVALAFTAIDHRARAEIVRLAELHVRGADGGSDEAEDPCPIIHEGTQITSTPIQGGILLYVTVLERAYVAGVQDETSERLALMPSLPAMSPRPTRPTRIAQPARPAQPAQPAIQARAQR